MNIKKYFWLFVSVLLAAPLSFTDAATQPQTSARFPNPFGRSGITTLDQFVAKMLEIVARIGAIIAVFFVIYAGFLFVTAAGNEEKLKKAKSALLWALVGTAVLVGAQAIATVITGTIDSLGR